MCIRKKTSVYPITFAEPLNRLLIRTSNADPKLPYQDMGNTENALDWSVSTAGRRLFRDQAKKFNNTLASNQNEDNAVNASDSDGLLEICVPGNITVFVIKKCGKKVRLEL